MLRPRRSLSSRTGPASSHTPASAARSTIWPALALLLGACGDPVAAQDDDATASTSSTSSTATDDAPTSTTAPDSTAGTDDTGDPPAPTCCGCLCVDPAWSCAATTCVLPDGTAAALTAEAGFIAVTSGGTAPVSRMWYVFRPADSAPEDRPLAVFFNGGPGYSTAILFGMNTNAVTMDPDVTGVSDLAANPHSWTRFANVLYIDPREVGYSYDVPPADGAGEQILFIPEHDAATFVRLLLAFLERHPQIRANPVVLVGESYGGHRAALMLEQILFHAELDTSHRYRDPTLHEALLRHFAAVFPDVAPEDLTPAQVAHQFGYQVLIQPAIDWLTTPTILTPDEEQSAALGCLPDSDHIQCDEPPGWAGQRTDRIVAGLRDPAILSRALGVDVASIAWMHADARAAAYPRGLADEHDEAALRAVFGELAPEESFYYPSFRRGGLVIGYDWTAKYYGYPYLRVMAEVQTFITDAGKDLVVYGPDIPRVLASYDDLVVAAVHDTAPIEGEPRPGRMRLTYTQAAGGMDREVRFPHYPLAGHMVTSRDPGELAEDVCRWLPDCELP